MLQGDVMGYLVLQAIFTMGLVLLLIVATILWVGYRYDRPWIKRNWRWLVLGTVLGNLMWAGSLGILYWEIVTGMDYITSTL